jgi:hypothetical protein
MALEPPLWASGPSGSEYQHSALLDRRLLAAIFNSTGGVLGSTQLQVTQRGLGANMSVDISAGSCVVPGTSISNQGNYLCRSTAVENVAVATAPGSGTRTDLVVARVADSEVTGVADGFILEVLTGTTTVPANAISLATISIPSGTASITNSAITDTRQRATINSGLLEHVSVSTPTASARIAPKSYVDTTVSTSISAATTGSWQRLTSGTFTSNSTITLPTGLTGNYVELTLRGTLDGVGELGVAINTSEGGGNLGYEWVYTTFAASTAQTTYQNGSDTTVIVSRWSTISNTATVRIFFHNTPNTSSSVPFRYETSGTRHSSSTASRWTTMGSGRALNTGTATGFYVAARTANIGQIWWQLCGFKA